MRFVLLSLISLNLMAADEAATSKASKSPLNFNHSLESDGSSSVSSSWSDSSTSSSTPRSISSLDLLSNSSSQDSLSGDEGNKSSFKADSPPAVAAPPTLEDRVKAYLANLDAVAASIRLEEVIQAEEECISKLFDKARGGDPQSLYEFARLFYNGNLKTHKPDYFKCLALYYRAYEAYKREAT